MSYIKEDYERVSEIDEMYLMEHEHQMIVEWQQWEEEESRRKLLPAKIEVVTLPKLIPNE